jgi:hypothetical protein
MENISQTELKKRAKMEMKCKAKQKKAANALKETFSEIELLIHGGCANIVIGDKKAGMKQLKKAERLAYGEWIKL